MRITLALLLLLSLLAILAPPAPIAAEGASDSPVFAMCWDPEAKTPAVKGRGFEGDSTRQTLAKLSAQGTPVTSMLVVPGYGNRRSVVAMGKGGSVWAVTGPEPRLVGPGSPGTEIVHGWAMETEGEFFYVIELSDGKVIVVDGRTEAIDWRTSFGITVGTANVTAATPEGARNTSPSTPPSDSDLLAIRQQSPGPVEVSPTRALFYAQAGNGAVIDVPQNIDGKEFVEGGVGFAIYQGVDSAGKEIKYRLDLELNNLPKDTTAVFLAETADGKMTVYAKTKDGSVQKLRELWIAREVENPITADTQFNLPTIHWGYGHLTALRDPDTGRIRLTATRDMDSEIYLGERSVCLSMIIDEAELVNDDLDIRVTGWMHDRSGKLVKIRVTFGGSTYLEGIPLEVIPIRGDLRFNDIREEGKPARHVIELLNKRGHLLILSVEGPKSDYSHVANKYRPVIEKRITGFPGLERLLEGGPMNGDDILLGVPMATVSSTPIERKK